MDLKNQISFHEYVDNHPNIVLIAQLVNGNTVIGYSAAPFTVDSNCDFQKGFLFSVKIKKIFDLKR
jgi:hypothetical protein